MSNYGYCPQCNAPGLLRERRPNGNDKCGNGHTYPSSTALKVFPTVNAPGDGTVGFVLRDKISGHFVAIYPESPLRYYDRDVLKALRFARREDAEAFARYARMQHGGWEIVPVQQAVQS